MAFSAATCPPFEQIAAGDSDDTCRRIKKSVSPDAEETLQPEQKDQERADAPAYPDQSVSIWCATSRPVCPVSRCVRLLKPPNPRVLSVEEHFSIFVFCDSLVKL